jgi:hypothetical protein
MRRNKTKCRVKCERCVDFDLICAVRREIRERKLEDWSKLELIEVEIAPRRAAS